MKYIKLFEEQSIEDLIRDLDSMAELVNFGLISRREYLDQTASINQKIKDLTKFQLTKSSKHDLYSKEWFDSVREFQGLRWLTEVIDSREYTELVQKGVLLSSSIAQLMNRTLVFSRNGRDRNPKKEFAIGFFGNTQRIRRIFPKTGVRDMDQTIKNFEGLGLSDVDFFKQAMAWAVESIDFTSSSFLSKRAVSSSAKSSQEENLLRSLISRLVEESLSKISGQNQSQIKTSIYYAIGGGYSSSRRAATSELTQYFNGNFATLTINGSYPLTQDEVTVLSKPLIQIKWGSTLVFNFKGLITNLEDLNILPLTSNHVELIQVESRFLPLNLALENLDRVLAKLASVGVRSVNSISGIYSPTGDENFQIQEIADRNGISIIR